MSSAIRLCLIAAVLCVTICSAEDLVVGYNGIIAHSKSVKLSSMPFAPRVKNIYYTTKDPAKVIKGVSAIDLDKSKASAMITAGGVGSHYVNIKLMSQRGEGLNYLVQILV